MPQTPIKVDEFTICLDPLKHNKLMNNCLIDMGGYPNDVKHINSYYHMSGLVYKMYNVMKTNGGMIAYKDF